MKFSFTTALASLLLASVPAFSQNIAIGYPPADATVIAGSQITVEIDKPDFQSSSNEVALVLALSTCFSGICTPPENAMGSILYNGPLNTQREANLPMKPPHQNFTITLPGTGLYQLNAFHVYLLGAANTPITDFQNITLNVQ